MPDFVLIKIHQSIYYANKPAFLKLLKTRKLKWSSKSPTSLIEGWFNGTSEYVQKLPEESEYKVFKIFGCLEIVEFLSSLSASEPPKSNFPDKLPWEFGEFRKYHMKQLLDNWDTNFKVVWR